MVGNSIGEENIPLAKKVYRYGFAMCFVLCLSLASMTYLLSDKVALFYTSEEEMSPVLQSVLESLFPSILLFAFTLIP